MLNSSKLIIYIYKIFITSMLFANQTSIKTFHVFSSFGTQTKELKNSIILTYDKSGFILDSTVFTHNVPLNEKYIYVTGKNEGLKLQRTYDKKKVLSYIFENDSLGKRISTTLRGSKDSIYWKEFNKYDERGILIKKLRYNPSEIKSEKSVQDNKYQEKLIWGELYNYNASNTILEKNELYDSYVLETTIFDIDSLNNIKKRGEYFDPSVIFRTIYFHNSNKKLIKEISVGENGKSIGSKSYSYDILGRKTQIKTYDSDGLLYETLNISHDDKLSKIYEYYFDSSTQLFSVKETLLNSQGSPYVIAVLDDEDRILEKNIYYYDVQGRIDQIKQYDMIRQRQYDNFQIPVKVSIYEY